MPILDPRESKFLLIQYMFIHILTGGTNLLILSKSFYFHVENQLHLNLSQFEKILHFSL